MTTTKPGRLTKSADRSLTPRAARDVPSIASLDANIIIANAPDPVFVSDLEGKILLANEAVSELLGFRQDEVLEQSLSRFISPQETREFMTALDEVVERGVTKNARLNPRSASGEIIPTSLNASALRDPDGHVIGAIGILRDMRELDKARAYAESLIKNAPDPVFVSDLEGKILQANDAVYTLLGFRTDEVIEQSLGRFISPEETREFTAALREVVERGVTRNAVLHPRTASDEVIPTSLNASALREQDGRVIGAIGIPAASPAACPQRRNSLVAPGTTPALRPRSRTTALDRGTSGPAQAAVPRGSAASIRGGRGDRNQNPARPRCGRCRPPRAAIPGSTSRERFRTREPTLQGHHRQRGGSVRIELGC